MTPRVISSCPASATTCPVEEASPLRRARLARNWTLEDVVEEIDLGTAGGHSGVTPSMVSGWELERHTTSIGHRKTLCEIYGLPPDGLFAHQDQGLAVGAAPRLVAGFPELQQAMLATVTGARQCLVALGSRSRDARYLEAIEEVLGQRPALVCYRVLFGPPRHQVLKDHLSRLVELRNPADRSPARAEVPLIADYIPLVEQAVTNGTRRVYGPYWARVVRE